METQRIDNFGRDSQRECGVGEQLMELDGVAGRFCAASCSATRPCPGAGSACIIVLPGEAMPSRCATICDPQVDNKCSRGASCKPAEGYGGVCTHDD